MRVFSNTAVASVLSSHDKKKIGEQIWLNESNKRKDLLVFWNQHEPFPSLGIGHCIWFPEGQQAVYSQQFPLLCNYLKEHGVVLPAWLEGARKVGAPWQSRQEFLQDTYKRKDLLKLLLSTIDLQTSFMIKRLEQEWALILQSVPKKQKKKLSSHFTLMRSSPLGTYALVDYLNFKGSGKEWGLLYVMQSLPENLTQKNICKAFAASAAEALTLRIKNSGPNYDHLKFLSGWIKRVYSYANNKLFGV